MRIKNSKKYILCKFSQLSESELSEKTYHDNSSRPASSPSRPASNPSTSSPSTSSPSTSSPSTSSPHTSSPSSSSPTSNNDSMTLQVTSNIPDKLSYKMDTLVAEDNINNLKKWLRDSRTTIKRGNELLKILKNFNSATVTHIPESIYCMFDYSSRASLQVITMNPGQFLYFGIKKVLSTVPHWFFN